MPDQEPDLITGWLTTSPDRLVDELKRIRRGQLVVNNLVVAAPLIARLREAKPHGRLQVVVANVRAARRLAKPLREVVGDDDVITVDGVDGFGSHTKFAIWHRLRVQYIPLANNDTLVCVGTRAASAMAERCIREPVLTQALFCIRTPAERRHSVEVRLGKWFGRRFGSSASNKPDVATNTVEWRSSARRQGRTTLPAKMEIWNDDERNRALADLANAFADANREALQAVGQAHLLDAHWNPECKPSVVVLVESPQHGRALARLLPSFRLVTSIPPPADDPEQGVEIMSLNTYLMNRIMTFVAAAHERLQAHIVIRVDGTRTPWQPDWDLGSKAEHPHGVQIIEVVRACR